MDLIDREALINAVEDLYEYAELGEALDVIKSAPTVEERPHGKWLEWVDEKWGGTTIYCSVCKLKALRSSTNDFVMSNFCPNCGADMREANDET